MKCGLQTPAYMHDITFSSRKQLTRHIIEICLCMTTGTSWAVLGYLFISSLCVLPIRSSPIAREFPFVRIFSTIYITVVILYLYTSLLRRVLFYLFIYLCRPIYLLTYLFSSSSTFTIIYDISMINEQGQQD